MGIRRAIGVTAVALVLSGCASLAVRPCDSIPERDSKYVARFFLGIVTLGISEAAIQQEQFIEAREGWRFCPPPVAWQGPPPAGGPRTPGLLVNGTKWSVQVYLDADPGAAGALPLLTLRPGEARQVALLAGPHRVVARPLPASPGGPAPEGRYERQIRIDPRDRSFRLEISEAEFKK
jgi:hypothetical protein